ncbi:MAG: DUF305 domain-containing protein [Rhodoglobus sp.]
MNPESSSEQSKTTADNAQGGEHSQRRMYLLFGAMILTSTTVMFLLTYTNVFSIDHVRWSEERFYMALLMGSAMAIIMLSFMWAMMYRNVKVNIAIIVVALILGGAGLGLSRSQALVGDVAYMEGMIPHHSIAILTSGRANLDDVRVRELADGIIDAQEKEIAEMNWLVDDIAANGMATTQEEADQRPVPDFSNER